MASLRVPFLPAVRCVWVGLASVVGFVAWMGIFELVYEDPAGPTRWWSLLPLLLAVLAVVSVVLVAAGVAGRRLVLKRPPREAWRGAAVDGLAAVCVGCPALLVVSILAQTIASCSFGSGC